MKWHVVVGMLQRPFEALQLQGCDFVTTGGLNGVEFTGLGGFGAHVGSPLYISKK
jgi:hypothetical protein